MENDNVICHIIGLNSITKEKFKNKINDEIYEIIDLDNINKDILSSTEMDSMFNQYQKLKDSKNDRCKDIDKKMTNFWINNFNNLLYTNLSNKKKSILIGSNLHYRNLSKKVDVPTNNKFLIDINKEDIKKLIEYNLNRYKNQIINGTYSLNHLDYKFIENQKNKINNIYLKNGYLMKNIDQIISILKLLESKDIEGKGLWVSIKDNYNINTKIHPKKNGKIFGFTEPIQAIIESFNWKEDEIKTEYSGDNNIKISLKTNEGKQKFKTNRYLYLVDKSTFIPHDKGNNMKFFSQTPINILDKENINNVYEKLKYLGIISSK